MKTITSFLFIFCTINMAMAQWQPTGISTNTIEGIYDVASHNGTLFASSNTDGFIKSTDNGTTWSSVGQTGFTTNPTSRRVTHIRSAGSDLYVVTFYANNASSMIYKSTDNGQTFVPDIDGMPANSGEIVDVDYFYSHNNYLVAVVNNGNYIKHASASTWQRNNNASTEFAEHFTFYNAKFYAWYGYHLHTSSDNGQTWSTAADANLPSLFLANNLVVNKSDGRIYMSGKRIIENNNRLYYSDNEGASWTQIDISSFMGNNWIGVPQKIQEMYVNNSYILLGLDNNASNSTPDVFVSTDGGATFSSDTVGLPSSAGGTTNAIAFTLHNDYLFMALNYIDIYRKDFSALSLSDQNFTTDIIVYPNPSKGRINIKSLHPIDRVEVFDVQGKLLFTDVQKPSQLLDIAKAGVYFVKFINESGQTTTKKIIIN